jgi:hypothetical protein
MPRPEEIIYVDPTQEAGRDALSATVPTFHGHLGIISVTHDGNPPEWLNGGKTQSIYVRPDDALQVARDLADRLRGVYRHPSGNEGDPTVVTTEAQIRLIVAELKKEFLSSSAKSALHKMANLLTGTNNGAYTQALRDKVAAAPQTRLC